MIFDLIIGVPRTLRCDGGLGHEALVVELRRAKGLIAGILLPELESRPIVVRALSAEAFVGLPKCSQVLATRNVLTREFPNTLVKVPTVI